MGGLGFCAKNTQHHFFSQPYKVEVNLFHFDYYSDRCPAFRKRRLQLDSPCFQCFPHAKRPRVVPTRGNGERRVEEENLPLARVIFRLLVRTWHLRVRLSEFLGESNDCASSRIGVGVYLRMNGTAFIVGAEYLGSMFPTLLPEDLVVDSAAVRSRSIMIRISSVPPAKPASLRSAILGHSRQTANCLRFARYRDDSLIFYNRRTDFLLRAS